MLTFRHVNSNYASSVVGCTVTRVLPSPSGRFGYVQARVFITISSRRSNEPGRPRSTVRYRLIEPYRVSESPRLCPALRVCSARSLPSSARSPGRLRPVPATTARTTTTATGVRGRTGPGHHSLGNSPRPGSSETSRRTHRPVTSNVNQTSYRLAHADTLPAARE